MTIFTQKQTYIKGAMPELNDYVTASKAAEILGYHVNHVRRMVKNGYLVGLKAGHSLFISKKSINDFIEKSAQADYKKHDRRKKQLLEKQ